MIKKVLLAGMAFIIPLALFSKSTSLNDLEAEAKKNNKKAAEELINMLAANEDSEMRASAARSLGNARVKSANDQLLKSLVSDDDVVREEIIISLGKIGIAANSDKIIEIVNNNNEKRRIRIVAIKSLGFLGSDNGVRVLITKLDANDQKFKDTAIAALGDTGSPAAAAALVKLMQKEKDNVLAAESLNKLKSKDSYKGIADLLKAKVGTREYDQAFMILAGLLGDERYADAKGILAKAYLTSHSSKYDFKESVLKALKAMKVKSSYCVVNATSLRMRKEPNDRSPVSGNLQKNEFATVLEATKIKHTIDNIKDYWYRIQNEKGETGWVFGGYLLKLEID